MSLSRIALIGPMGIGKTTAIRALCGEETVDCDVINLDRSAHAKEMTTVGADFGEVEMGDGERLQLYGCPGQGRFDFVRQWVLSVSIGAFIMVDVNDEHAVEDTARLLGEVEAAASRPLALILCARPATPEQIDAFSAGLAQAGCRVIPIVHADPRDGDQMLDALQVLAAMLSLDEEVA